MVIEKINGYALALFSLGIEEKKLNSVKKDADLVIDVISANEPITPILSSKVLSSKIKNKLIDDAFDIVNTNIKTFIKIVSNESRGKYILPVLEKLIKLINEKENVKEGVVYTTEPLTKLQVKKFEDKVEKKLGFKPGLKNKIDPTLLAGFKVVVGDEVIEDTVVSRLGQLKEKLLGKGVK